MPLKSGRLGKVSLGKAGILVSCIMTFSIRQVTLSMLLASIGCNASYSIDFSAGIGRRFDGIGGLSAGVSKVGGLHHSASGYVLHEAEDYLLLKIV
jgi:hypothetical protein